MKQKQMNAATVLLAIILWLGVGLALGWYYTFTYYGRAGWPMPLPEVLTDIILYYLSALYVPTPIQAIHWMLVFPIAAALWTANLSLLAPRFGSTRPPYPKLLLQYALATTPILLTIPWLTYIAGNTEEGWTLTRAITVALRRGFVSPWPTLSPICFTLAILSLALQIRAYRKLFTTKGRKALLHHLTAGITLTLTAIILALAAAIPLRALLEIKDS